MKIINSTGRLEQCQQFLESILADKNIDFYSAKIAIINHMRSEYPDDFEKVMQNYNGMGCHLINLLACMIESNTQTV